ncbi:hypothetical protein KCU81_g846, partial [Aureobasidium melanogenum]
MSIRPDSHPKEGPARARFFRAPSPAGVVGRASISARLLPSAICFLLLRALSCVLPSDKSLRFSESHFHALDGNSLCTRACVVVKYVAHPCALRKRAMETSGQQPIKIGVLMSGPSSSNQLPSRGCYCPSSLVGYPSGLACIRRSGQGCRSCPFEGEEYRLQCQCPKARLVADRKQLVGEKMNECMNKGKSGGRALRRTRNTHIAEMLIFTRTVVANTGCNFITAQLLVGINLMTVGQRTISTLDFTRIIRVFVLADGAVLACTVVSTRWILVVELTASERLVCCSVVGCNSGARSEETGTAAGSGEYSSENASEDSRSIRSPSSSSSSSPEASEADATSTDAPPGASAFCSVEVAATSFTPSSLSSSESVEMSISSSLLLSEEPELGAGESEGDSLGSNFDIWIETLRFCIWRPLSLSIAATACESGSSTKPEPEPWSRVGSRTHWRPFQLDDLHVEDIEERAHEIIGCRKRYVPDEQPYQSILGIGELGFSTCRFANASHAFRARFYTSECIRHRVVGLQMFIFAFVFVRFGTLRHARARIRI